MVVLLLLAACALVPLKMVLVKMLPFDNKSEFQVMINMPDGTPLEQTTRVAQALGAYLSRQNDVTNYQIYPGTSGPYNFNGLVRHYYLRSQPNQADIQVNLLPADGAAHKAMPSQNGCGRDWTRLRSSTVHGFKCLKCRPDRRCCRRWWRKSTDPIQKGNWKSRVR